MSRCESDCDFHNHGHAAFLLNKKGTPLDGDQALVFELTGNLVTMRITAPFTNKKGLLFLCYVI